MFLKEKHGLTHNHSNIFSCLCPGDNKPCEKWRCWSDKHSTWPQAARVGWNHGRGTKEKTRRGAGAKIYEKFPVSLPGA